MYYVVQVKTGKEEKTISAIKKQLKENLKDKADKIDVFSPYKETLKKYKDGFRKVMERCFPGYIFVETDDPKELWIQLYFTPEYTKLLGREGYSYIWTPLDEDEARMIDILYSRNHNRVTSISNIQIKEGDQIIVLDGPLDGLLGKVKKVNLHKRLVTIGFTICNRPVEAELSINIVTNVINK